MKNFKRGLLPLRHGISLSKTMCLTTSEEVQRMSRIPYTLMIDKKPHVRHAMYSILYSQCYECHEQISIGSRLEVLDCCENIFKYLRSTKDLFLIIEEWIEL